MYRPLSRLVLSSRIRQLPDTHKAWSLSSAISRYYTVKVDYESKYAEKLHQVAAEKGLSMSELKEKAKQDREEERRRRKEREAIFAAQKKQQGTSSDNPTSGGTSTSFSDKLRKDSSPVKPLSSILNISKVLSTPHTPEQITHLWSAYHMSRSEGTGRGYLCAAIPLDLYKKMSAIAGRYPTFVVPIRRPTNSSGPPIETEQQDAYEFYLVQWNFYDAPPVPRADEDPFAKPSSESPNPKISTILFTPLEEYKLRDTFATPYFVLTNHTDLASQHNLVLMRGEITPGSGASTNYLLTQEDAQQLSMAIQKFYLWGNGDGEGEKLLKTFHERPSEFKWEDLLKVADWGV